MSIFFLPDDKVTFGLPVCPELFETQFTKISEKGIYSCGYCGYTEQKTCQQTNLRGLQKNQVGNSIK